MPLVPTRVDGSPGLHPRSFDGVLGIAALGGLYATLVVGERLARGLVGAWLANGGTTALVSGLAVLGLLGAVFAVTVRHTDLGSLAVGWPVSLQMALTVFGWFRLGGPTLAGAIILATARVGPPSRDLDRRVSAATSSSL